MSLAASIAHTFWAVILKILGLFRRAICRSGRGRKNSGTLLPMTTEHISVDLQQSVPSSDYELQSWDSWGDDPSSGFGHNAPGAPMYHGNGSAQAAHHRNNVQPEMEPDEPNFFQDMAPTIKKTTKVLIKKREENYNPNGISSRLTFAADMPIQTGPDLGTWDEGENAWGEEAQEDLSWQAEAAIKEKRRLERERKIAEHQRLKMEKESARNMKREGGQFSAVKLS